MKSHNLSSPIAERIVLVNPLGETVATNELGNAVRWSDQFTFSGFGDGDGKNAVPGTFLRVVYRRRQGEAVWRDIYGYTWTYSGAADGRVTTDSPWYVAEPDDELVYNECVAKLYDAIKDGAESGLATDWGERDETTGMLKAFAAPVTTFGTVTRDFARSLKRLGPIRAGSKAMASAWLAYQLAVAPTVHELDNLAKTLPSVFEAKTKTVRKASKASGIRTVDVMGNIFLAVPWKSVNKWTSSRRCELSVTYWIVDPSIFDAYRVGLTSFLSTPWNVLPLSFVADWAFNIGQYLQSVEGAMGLGLEYVRGYKTESQRDHNDYVLTCDAGNSTGHQRGYLSGYRQVSGKSRSSLGGFPMPHAPRFKAPFTLGSSRILTAGALLRSFLPS